MHRCPSMSSTTTSSANFHWSSILTGLDSYTNQTGIDLTEHPFADELQDCRSPDDVLQILSEREFAFGDDRDRHHNIINHVRPVVQVIHAFSAVLGETAGFVSSGIEFILSDRIFMPYKVPFQPTTAIFAGIDILLSVSISLLFYISTLIPLHIRLLLALVQAMTRFPASLNASPISLTASIFILRFHFLL